MAFGRVQQCLAAALGVLACAGSDADSALATFPSSFVWGLATAPAQSEDVLEDDWLDFAQEGHVAAWKNIPHPEERLRFWTHPEVEIDLARRANVKVLRLGVAWERLYPEPERFNETAMERYVDIVQQVKAAGLLVMMTLFHHSLPTWAHRMNGWVNNKIQPFFADFFTKVVTHLGSSVDYWVTFNEPHVYVGLVYCAGIWPPGKKVNPATELGCILPTGDYNKAMTEMGIAHKNFAKYCRESVLCNGSIGVAHNVANNMPYQPLDTPIVAAMNAQAYFPFIDDIKEDLDFFGMNYYGRELIHGLTPIVVPDHEYSESGRCVDPDGLYKMLKVFWDRYKKHIPQGIIITENGISDGSDILRQSYLAEHLVAIDYARKQGIEVNGYIHWTISDNWEWADGYCPKFGLVDVNRSSPDLQRLPRQSYYMYSEIAKTGNLTKEQRDSAWSQVKLAQETNATRPFCRDADGLHSFDTPVQRPFAKMDWRFQGPQEGRQEFVV